MQQSANLSKGNSLLTASNRTRDLRSSHQNVLFVSRIKTKMGEGSLSVASPKLWNRLFCEIRISKTVQSLRKKIKTFHFNQAFST